MTNNQKQFKSITSISRAILFILLIAVTVTPASAATNLIKNGSFETDIYVNWGIWQDQNSIRQYQLYRSFDAPYANGSYSAAIEAKGDIEESSSAILVSDNKNNNFTVNGDKTYYLTFYAKSDSNFVISTYLQDINSYAVITPTALVNITTDWQKHIISLTPTATTTASLCYFLSNLPDNSTLWLDGVQLFESNFTLSTAEVKGYAGDIDKTIRINNISSFTEKEVAIELPYYDDQTSTVTTKRFNPVKIVGDNVYLNMYEQTFSGIGSVFVNNAFVGQFNYTVLPKISSFYPSLMRVNEDVTISGSGFSPLIASGNINVTFNIIDAYGKRTTTWVKPHTIDTKLSQIAVTLPLGIISGQFYVQSSYINFQGQVVDAKSNTLSYKVKPLIYSLAWSKRGYDQVGDKLTIYGKGVSNSPQVVFYNSLNQVIARTPAVFKNIYSEEIIEVVTPDRNNIANIIVLVDGVESDYEQALSYSAKPRLISVQTKNSRKINNTGLIIPAASVGEIITINGQGFTSTASSSVVEFQGSGNPISAQIISVDAAGRIIKVQVPVGAQNGSLAVVTNNQKSNILTFEIIPSLISYSPDPVAPGQMMQIHASGVGSNENLTTIYFKLNNDTSLTIKPLSSNVVTDAETIINIKAPLAISSQYSSVNIQYENWRSDGVAILTDKPTITNASIDMDNKILIIQGYGFSTKPIENIITYKYADADKTVINPSVKMLGVFPTEEGQEIRIQILDDYHYGYVIVTVNGQASNEENFGPAKIRNISRRVEYVKSLGRVMGVLYISGANFGSTGGVKVGEAWSSIHYRSDTFIIAVVDQDKVYDNPVIVAK